MQDGDGQSTERLIPLVYDELRGLARSWLRRTPPGQTLQPTALVHEAWLRLEGRGDVAWEGRAHFFAAAAESMRRILVESVRRKQRERRGGGRLRVELRPELLALEVDELELLALHDALEELEARDERAAQVVKLCWFAGLTQDQVAELLGLSRRTIQRDWTVARAWLGSRMQERRGHDS